MPNETADIRTIVVTNKRSYVLSSAVTPWAPVIVDGSIIRLHWNSQQYHWHSDFKGYLLSCSRLPQARLVIVVGTNLVSPTQEMDTSFAIKH